MKKSPQMKEALRRAEEFKNSSQTEEDAIRIFGNIEEQLTDEEHFILLGVIQ